MKINACACEFRLVTQKVYNFALNKVNHEQNNEIIWQRNNSRPTGIPYIALINKLRTGDADLRF